MICNNCGASITDKAKFCSQCGSVLGTTESNFNNTAIDPNLKTPSQDHPSSNQKNESGGNAPFRGKKKRLVLLSIIAVVLVVAVVAVVLVLNNSKSTSNQENTEYVAEEQEQEKVEEDIVAPEVDSQPRYSINTDMIELLGKTSVEIEQLVGAYDGSSWLSGRIYRFGDYWFAIGEGEAYPEEGIPFEPTDTVQSILCLASEFIIGLEPSIDAAELDSLLGAQGQFISELQGSEVFYESVLSYELDDGLYISFDCSPEMIVSEGGLVVVGMRP